MHDVNYNIALNGKHLFRTDTYAEMDTLAMEAVLKAKFPAAEGFSITKRLRDAMSRVVELS